MRRVVVRIDRLVLKGFRAADRHDIALGLQAELGRAFGEHGAAARLGASAQATHLRAQGLPVEHGATPQDVGAGLGRGIGRELLK